MAAPPSEIGQYRILKKLGEGGMGAVYLGEHKVLGSKAAIKTILASSLDSEEAVNRLMDEGRALGSLRHPNIVGVMDFFTVGESHYLVMEYVEGESLDQRLKRDPPPIGEALEIALKVGTGIAAAHRKNILHRDIKPANVMIGGEGEVKVMDFGLAKFSGASTKTRTGYVVGTPRYMSPEQVRGQAVDASTDQYAFAVLVYRLLCGREPFIEGDSMAIMFKQVNDPPPPLSQWNAGVPAGVEAAVLRGMAKEAAGRWPDVAAFCAALQQAAGGAPATVPATQRIAVTPSASPATPVATRKLEGPPAAATEMAPAMGGAPARAPVPAPAARAGGGAAMALIGLIVLGGLAGGGWFAWKKFGGGGAVEVGSVPLSSPAQKDDAVLNQVFDAINDGKPEAAVDLLEKNGLAAKEGDGRKLYVTALAALEEWDKVTGAFGDRDPGELQGRISATEYFQLGVAWQNKKRNDYAAAAFQRSFEKNMALPAKDRNMDLALSAKQNFALSLLAMNHPEKAETELRALVQLDPKRAQAWFLLGEIAKGRKDSAAAREAYLKAADAESDAGRKAQYQALADGMK